MAAANEAYIQSEARAGKGRFMRLPALVQGLLLVLIVSLVGLLPPTVLDEVGVGLTPRVPWVAPVALAWMWLAWRILSRPGWRRDHLCVEHLQLSRWWTALAALAAGTGAIHAARMLSIRWIGEGDTRLPDISGYSTSVLLSSFLVTALTAGLFEEAAYRGFLRSVLEERYGGRLAIIFSALAFALAHISRGRGYFVVLPFVFVFGCLYGVVARRTGSILPGAVVHFGYNLLRLFERWLAPSPWFGTGGLAMVGIALTAMTLLLLPRRQELGTGIREK